jgi:T-complex protein 1 subunit eta
VDGVAFKKTFSYAGFEQQPKRFENPKVICLNIELELKKEKDNAEVRIDDPEVRMIVFHIGINLLLSNTNQLLTPNGTSFMIN